MYRLPLLSIASAPMSIVASVAWNRLTAG